MEEIFNSLIKVAPLIKELFEEDTAITVEDNKEFLYILRGKDLDMPHKVRDKSEDNVSRDTIRKNKKTVKIVNFFLIHIYRHSHFHPFIFTFNIIHSWGLTS
ncbi:hypothetical protein [Clostridium akagii]|uniref:hypothetical protein n=1 Tax=Clostridium akagii TaxID=91623 RepID=UPI00047D8F51|nr:hypothetical protein [Clostridium akagii]